MKNSQKIKLEQAIKKLLGDYPDKNELICSYEPTQSKIKLLYEPTVTSKQIYKRTGQDGHGSGVLIISNHSFSCFEQWQIKHKNIEFTNTWQTDKNLLIITRGQCAIPSPINSLIEAERCIETAKIIFDVGDCLRYRHSVIFCGYAIENAIKFSMTQDNGVDKYFVTKGKSPIHFHLEEILKHPDIFWLSNALNENEKQLIEDTNQHILWGKYPSATKTTSMYRIQNQNNIFNDITCWYQSIENFKQIVELVKKIMILLEQHHSKELQVLVPLTRTTLFVHNWYKSIC